ncbi:MAG: hypothetical protein IAE97_07465 [Chthoniobacterales bacterium]|nr:hypothetical protein [Chthoniobacterales bacterium]
MEKKATLLLPSGLEVYLEEFDLTLGELISLAQDNFDDSNISPEGFGALKYFFFVNSSRGSLIDGHLDLKRSLSTLFIDDRDVVELRLCNPAPQPDGSVLNPMRGVKTFVT